uniref:Uncharacterized protein n=1 Tax=Oryza brachyantha TaxID=4533 RepID=J3N209_ORYBR
MGNRYSALRPRRLVSSRRSEAAAAMGEEEEEPGSYEAACSGDPELRTFDTELRRRASHAITAVASGVEVRSMSLGSLREVTGCLVDMNQEVVRVLLDCKRDVWRSPDLFDLVEDYFEKYQDALQGHKEVVSAMQVGTFIAIKDLDSIRAVVDHLEVQISSMVDCVEFAERDEETAKFVIEEVKKKLEVFMKSVDELGEQADRCSRDIRKARTVVLQRIIHHPSN